MKKILHEVKLFYSPFCLLITDTVIYICSVFLLIALYWVKHVKSYCSVEIQNEYKEYRFLYIVSYNLKGKPENSCRIQVSKVMGVGV